MRSAVAEIPAAQRTVAAELGAFVDCPSCGAEGQTKARCEACGFTFPNDAVSAGDDALSLFLGLVCSSCDAYNDPGTAICMSCGTPLSTPSGEGDVVDEPAVMPASLAAPPPPLTVSSAMSAPPSWMTPPTGSTLSTQFAMKKVDIASAGGETLAAPAPTAPTQTPMHAPPTSLPPQPAPQSSWAPPASTQPSTMVPTTLPPQPTTQPPTQAPTTTTAARCWRCNNDLEDHDKFCRNCGARTDGGVGSAPAPNPNAPAATQMISALKLPTAPALGGQAGVLGTQILPAFKAAQSGVPAAPAAATPSTTLFFGAVTAERSAKLILVRGNSQFGNQWRLQSGETVIGRSDGMVLFPDDEALAPRHARLVFKGADLWLEPEPTKNGAFLRLREPVSLQAGDEFVVGAQRLRLMRDDERSNGVGATTDANGTRLLGSMVKPTPPIALLRVSSDPRFQEVYFRAQRLLTIGRVHCDVNFANDGFVSERHAQLTNVGTHVVLEDLKSRNGTYVRVQQPMKLLHGDLMLVGDQVLRIELPR